MAGNMEQGAEWRANRWRIATWGSGAALVLLPLLAMLVTDEVDWGPEDFVFAGVLVAGVGVTFELAARMTRNRAYLAAVGVALAAAFVLIWGNAAVGVIGSEDNPANLMYFGVLAIGVAGAVVARFRPGGMARAMVATALAQAAVAVIALVGGVGVAGPVQPWDVVGLTGFFAALWLLSAWMFRIAARGRGGRRAPG